MRTNSLPMNPAPPVTRSRISDVLNAPIESDSRVVIGDPALIRMKRVVGLGDVVVQYDVAQVQRLVAVSHEGWNGDHPRRVLAEDDNLDRSRGRRLLTQVDQDHASVALNDIPVVPLLLVPVEGLDQLRRIAAAGIGEAA